MGTSTASSHVVARGAALLRAVYSAAERYLGRVPQREASGTPAIVPDAGVGDSALRLGVRAVSSEKRGRFWTSRTQGHQHPECQYCCTCWETRRCQKRWSSPHSARNHTHEEPPGHRRLAAAYAAGSSLRGRWPQAPELGEHDGSSGSLYGICRRSYHETAAEAQVATQLAATHADTHAGGERLRLRDDHAEGRRPERRRLREDHAECTRSDGGAGGAFLHLSSKEKQAAIALVRRLTGGVSAGECLKALAWTNGDTEAAAVQLRKQGLSRAATRSAANCREGLVAVGRTDATPTTTAAVASEAGLAGARRSRRMSSVLVALTSETDFVAANARFVALAQRVANAAARLAAEGIDASDAGVLAKQNSHCTVGFAPQANPSSMCDVRTISPAALLETTKAADVHESLLTVQDIDGPGALLAPAGKEAGSLSEAPFFPTADAPFLGKSTGAPHGSSSSGKQTISVSAALALLSQQFGEKVELSDVKALVIEEEAQRPDQQQLEQRSDRSSAASNTAVGVYVHGRVAEGVGRAAAMVCLRWRAADINLSSHTKGAEARESEREKKLERLAQLLCLQVLATRPRYVRLSDIPTDEYNRERQILTAAAAAAAAAKRAASDRRGTVPSPGSFTSGGPTASCDAGAAPIGDSTNVDTVVEARLQGTVREQTLLEQEFLPLRRFYAEILECGDAGSSSSTTDDEGNLTSKVGNAQSSKALGRVTSSDGSLLGGGGAQSHVLPARLTVKEALEQAAVGLCCSTIDVETVQFLAVGQS